MLSTASGRALPATKVIHSHVDRLFHFAFPHRRIGLMADHITVESSQLAALSRSYQQISHRVTGLSTIITMAPASAELSVGLPGARIIAAASTTCEKWARSLTSLSTSIDDIAGAADALAANVSAHETDQSIALDCLAWSR